MKEIIRCLVHPRTIVITLIVLACSLLATYVYCRTLHLSQMKEILLLAWVCPLVLSPPACVYFNLLLQRLTRQEAILREEHDALQVALQEINTLSGMLPICAHCKKVRDDTGYWNQIEAYLNEHSEAELTHSICPDCMTEHFPGSS